MRAMRTVPLMKFWSGSLPARNGEIQPVLKRHCRKWVSLITGANMVSRRIVVPWVRMILPAMRRSLGRASPAREFADVLMIDQDFY